MIVVEGMDNTGKTTLVEYLEEALMLVAEKSPGPAEPDSHAEWLLWIEESLLRADTEHAIYDRYPCISEYIYGPAVRGMNILRDTDYLARFLLCRPLVIYCRPSDHIIKRFGDREQMNGVKEKAKKLLEDYDHLYNWLFDRVAVMKYDWEVQEPQAVVNRCKAYIQTYIWEGDKYPKETH